MRGRRICLILAVILLLIAMIPAFLWLNLCGEFVEQTAAERWKGSNDARFAQVTGLLDESVGLDPVQEYSLRQSIETALSGESEEAWVLAMSGFCAVNVSDDDEQVNARGICTSGNYAHFHPIRMVSGAWFDPNDVNQDGVVLDMQLAWRLFGGYDLQGFAVRINGQPVQIVGVVRLPEAGIEEDIYGSTPTVWFSMGLMERLGLNVKVTCVEAVLPNPVSHFAADKLSGALGISSESENSELVENTGRFGILQSLSAFFRPDKRVIRTNRVVYPYWENAARVGESRCGLYAAMIALLLLFPCGVAVYWLFHGLALLKKAVGSLLKKRKW